MERSFAGVLGDRPGFVKSDLTKPRILPSALCKVEPPHFAHLTFNMQLTPPAEGGGTGRIPPRQVGLRRKPHRHERAEEWGHARIAQLGEARRMSEPLDPDGTYPNHGDTPRNAHTSESVFTSRAPKPACWSSPF